MLFRSVWQPQIFGKAGFHPCQAKEAACRPAEQAGQADPQGQRHGSADRWISQAFSHTYLVGAVIVLILSPIALLTDRKSLKS